MVSVSKNIFVGLWGVPHLLRAWAAQEAGCGSFDSDTPCQHLAGARLWEATGHGSSDGESSLRSLGLQACTEARAVWF